MPRTGPLPILEMAGRSWQGVGMITTVAGMHGLTWDRAKERWKLRVTLDRGRKLVGKRVGLYLQRGLDEQTAMECRNALVEGIEALGLQVKFRPVSRRGDRGATVPQ